MIHTARVKGSGPGDRDAVRLLCGASRNCPGQLGTLWYGPEEGSADAWMLMLNAVYRLSVGECADGEHWAPSSWAQRRGSLVPRRPRHYPTPSMQIERDPVSGSHVRRLRHGAQSFVSPVKAWLPPERHPRTGRLVGKSAPVIAGPYWPGELVTVLCPVCDQFSAIDWDATTRKFATWRRLTR